MEYSYLNALVTIILLSLIFRASAQISTPCTSSMITTFTPCLNFVTGSSATGSSPTQDCCNSLKSLMSESMDCACLIVTGNVPLSIPLINRNLAISLPQLCQSSVPVQCKASAGDPLPAPGPVLFGPSAAPQSPSSKAGATVAAPPPADRTLDLSPELPPEFSLGPTANTGIRPVVQLNAASNQSAISLSYLLVIMLMGITVKFF